LGPNANLIIYEVVQGGHHEERLQLQESMMRNKQERQRVQPTCWNWYLASQHAKKYTEAAAQESCKKQAQQELAKQQAQ
jgi:hypothetical protein